MNISYRRDRENNYMVLEAPGEIQGNEYQVRMLLVNEIPGLLRCKLRTVDGISSFYYEITSRQPIERIFEQRAAGYEDIRAVVTGLGKALEGIERYLLADEGLLLDPGMIYMDVETKEVSFCYLPFGTTELSESFRELAEYLLKHLDHEEEQAVLLGYQIYSGTMEESYHVSTVLQKAVRQSAGSAGEKRAAGEKHQEKRAAGEKHQEKRAAEEKDQEKRAPEEKNQEKCAAGEKHWEKRAVGVKHQDKCSSGRKEPGIPSEKKPIRGMVTGQEHLRRRKQKRRIAAVVFAAAAALAALTALLWFRILTLTQAGGILFLAVGVSVYLKAGIPEKKEKQKGQTQGWRPQEQREERSPDRHFFEDNSGQETDWEVCDFYEESGQPREEEANHEKAEQKEQKETDDEETYGQTTLLRGGRPGENPVLISIHPDVRENAVIHKEKFVIGKLKGQVDLPLNLSVISRIHAGIEYRDGEYFLTDFNSTNGTFLNGERLEANEYRRIHTGDEICFAGAGYYFKE